LLGKANGVCDSSSTLYLSDYFFGRKIARDLSLHDVGSTDDYRLHRILHGVPEGIVDIPPMHAFPMESNLDAMGGCKSFTPNISLYLG